MLISSEFRLNTLIVPFESKCTYGSEDWLAPHASIYLLSYLGAFTIVFVLTGELLVLKPV